MKTTISIKNKILVLNWNSSIEFEEDICEVIDFEHTVVVLTVPEKGHYTDDRIYGVRGGKIVWRVQDLNEAFGYKAPHAYDPYTGIRVYDKDHDLIIAVTSLGFRALIDPETGKIVGKETMVK